MRTTHAKTTSGPAPAAAARKRRRVGIPRWLFSMKFAIWIAVLLAVASIAGVLVQEFYPVRNEVQAAALAEHLPGPVYRAFMALHLYDPFRAGWFRVLLGLLSASLVVCSAKRFRSALRQAFRLHTIREPRSLLLLHNSATLHHVEPDVFDTAVARLRRRLYIGKVERRPDERVAALHQGGISRTGPVLLHLGILALVLGGMASSIVGRKTFVELAPGESAPLPGSAYVLRLDDFRIDTNERGQVKQYRSNLAILDGEVIRAEREISVNHPLRFAGFNVYQSSYNTDPSRAARIVFEVRDAATPAAHGDPRAADACASDPGGAHDHAHVDAPGSSPGTHAPTPPPAAAAHVVAEMDQPQAVPGHPGYTFRVTRFFGHLKLTSQGPVNAARDLKNPAALLVIEHDGKPVGEQWAFGNFPAHARGGALPFTLEMRDLEPVLASGLEVNTNPGAPLIWFGFGLSTVGLVLSFLIQHRIVFLLARPEKRGWTLWIAGRSDRERLAFAREFATIVEAVRRDARKPRREQAADRDIAAESDAPQRGAADEAVDEVVSSSGT